jgi:hypothetical protein
VHTLPSTGMWFLEEKAPIANARATAMAAVAITTVVVLKLCRNSIVQAGNVLSRSSPGVMIN